jgi:hypothetical protein
MRVPSAVITGIEGKGDTEVKDKESGDMWCEALESITHLECDIPKELRENCHMEEEMDNACGCKEKNFWNCSTKVLRSMIEPDETTASVLWYGDL